MTKMVRVENADSGTSFKVLVEHWLKGRDGNPDVLQSTHKLDWPTSMVELGIHSGSYLVVKEPDPVAVPGDGGPDPTTPHK